MRDGPGQQARPPPLGKMAINGARALARRWAVATTSGARGQRLLPWAVVTTSGGKDRGTLAQEARKTINGVRAQRHLLLLGVVMTNGARGQPHLLPWDVITTNGARALLRVDAGRTNGAALQRQMDITRGRRKTRALICGVARAEEPNQRLRQMGNGGRGIGARQTVGGTTLNRLDNGGNPRLRRRLKRRARLNQATAAPTARGAWQVWAINPRHRPMLAAVGASARRPPGKLNPGGKHPVGSRLNQKRQGHAAARAIKPRRSPNGTSQAGARLSLPGKPREQAASGDRLNQLLAPTPAARVSLLAPGA